MFHLAVSSIVDVFVLLPFLFYLNNSYFKVKLLI